MAARRRVVWTRGAHHELGGAIEYIAQDSVEAALVLPDSVEILAFIHSARDLARSRREG